MSSIDDQMVIDTGGRLQFASSPTLLDFNIVDGPGRFDKQWYYQCFDYEYSDSRLKVFDKQSTMATLLLRLIVMYMCMVRLPITLPLLLITR